MLYIIGIGLKPEHITQEAISAIKKCEIVFLETYTSTYSTGTVKDLQSLIGKKVFQLDREYVEQKSHEMLATARNNNVAFLVYGNALSATTHIQLLLDAKKAGVKCSVLAGISVFDFLTFTGLDQYRFGRTATIVAPKENYSPRSFYDIIAANHSAGMHALCLLDIEAEKNKLMGIKEGIEILEKIESERTAKILQNSVLIGIAGAGSEKMEICVGKIPNMKKFKFTQFPQSLVVAAELNEKEREALEELHGWKT